MNEKIRCHLSSVYTLTEIYSSNRKILLDNLGKNMLEVPKCFCMIILKDLCGKKELCTCTHSNRKSQKTTQQLKSNACYQHANYTQTQTTAPKWYSWELYKMLKYRRGKTYTQSLGFRGL